MNLSAEKLQLPKGLAIRPSVPADNSFIQELYHSTRKDLQAINADEEFVHELIEQQFIAQSVGYGSSFPNAYYFIIEKQQQSIGRATLDFMHDAIHVVDIAFIPEARNKGYGEGVIKALQYAAEKSCAALILSVYSNNWVAKNLYGKLGFQVEQSIPPYERLIWYPTLYANHNYEKMV